MRRQPLCRCTNTTSDEKMDSTLKSDLIKTAVRRFESSSTCLHIKTSLSDELHTVDRSHLDAVDRSHLDDVDRSHLDAVDRSHLDTSV